jgi:hypothetical protein
VRNSLPLRSRLRRCAHSGWQGVLGFRRPVDAANVGRCRVLGHRVQPELHSVKHDVYACLGNTVGSVSLLCLASRVWATLLLLCSHSVSLTILVPHITFLHLLGQHCGQRESSPLCVSHHVSEPPVISSLLLCSHYVSLVTLRPWCSANNHPRVPHITHPRLLWLVTLWAARGIHLLFAFDPLRCSKSTRSTRTCVGAEWHGSAHHFCVQVHQNFLLCLKPGEIDVGTQM